MTTRESILATASFLSGARGYSMLLGDREEDSQDRLCIRESLLDDCAALCSREKVRNAFIASWSPKVSIPAHVGIMGGLSILLVSSHYTFRPDYSVSSAVRPLFIRHLWSLASRLTNVLAWLGAEH